MKKNIFRIIIDVIMVALLLLMFSPKVISESFHEISGLVVFGLFLLHIALSWKWVVKVTQKLFGKLIPWRTRLLYILDVLLLVSVTTMIITGILISESILRNISAQGMIWKSLHYFAAAVSLLLVGAHLGLHWFFFKKMFSKIVRLPKPISTILSIVLLVAVIGYGGYNLVNSYFTDWLVGPFQTGNLPSGEYAMIEGDQGHQRPSGESYFSDGNFLGSSENSDSQIHPLSEDESETVPDTSNESLPDMFGQSQPENFTGGTMPDMTNESQPEFPDSETAPDMSNQTMPGMPDETNQDFTRETQPGMTHVDAGQSQPSNQGSWTRILNVIITYGSIALGIAGICRLIDWLFSLKKKPQTPSTNNHGRIGPLDQTKLLL